MLVEYINELCAILEKNDAKMTMQISDQLIYNNEAYSLDDEILEPFLQEKGIRSKHAGGFSANWRGYAAEFEIKNFEIHLNSKNNEFFENIIKELGSTKIHYLNKLIVLYSNVIGEYSNWSISLSPFFKCFAICLFNNEFIIRL